MWLINRILKWKGVPTEHQLIEQLPEGSLQNFSSEAEMFKHSEYHKWLVEDLELMAERWMFKGNKDSLLIGKGILYCLEIQAKNIATMAKGKIRQDSPQKKKMRRFN